MHNYWLIFFTFGDRKGCKFIKHALHERKPDHRGRAFFCFYIPRKTKVNLSALFARDYVRSTN